MVSQGYASAQYNLALMYRDGRGVARDAAQAQHWYEQAAAQGHAKAQYQLGQHYRNSDPQKARAWLEKDAAQDNADAKKALQTW